TSSRPSRCAGLKRRARRRWSGCSGSNSPIWPREAAKERHMSTETGGPAFPIHPASAMDGQLVRETQGMTLRDYFAARAMQGVLGNTKGQFGRGYPDANMNLAVASYAIADAMLAARESAA